MVYTKCELSLWSTPSVSSGSPGLTLLLTFIFILCHAWLPPMYTTLSTIKTSAHTFFFGAIFDYTHVGSATAYFKNLVTVAQKNSTVVAENHLQTPLDLVTVPQE